ENAQVCQNCSSPLPNRQPAGAFGDQPPAYQPPPPAQPYPQPQPSPPPSSPPPSYQQPQPSPYAAAPYGGYQQANPAFGMASARQYAGIGRRFVAYLLDGLVITAAAIPGFILLFVGGLMTSSRDSSDLAGVLIVIGYLVLTIGCLAMFVFNIYLLGR